MAVSGGHWCEGCECLVRANCVCSDGCTLAHGQEARAEAWRALEASGVSFRVVLSLASVVEAAESLRVEDR